MVGDWTFQTEASVAPGETPTRETGRERVRSLGGVWVVCEGRDDGGAHESMMTLGFDPQRGRFVGTFVSSTMTHLWRYEGTLDPDGRGVTFDTEGPSLTDDRRMGRYRDTIAFQSDDHRTLTSRFLADDGEWRAFMTAHYRRA